MASNLGLYIPITFDILQSSGGSMGYGYFILPLLLVLIVFSIPAIIGSIKYKTFSKKLFIFNIIGFILHLWAFITFYDLIFYAH